MKIKLLFFFLLTCCMAHAQFPQGFSSRGPGGGGALFAPSINPQNEDEYYVACDMSELFHTSDFGLTYEEVNFSKVQSGHGTKMVFTINANIRYTIDYTGNSVLPVKTIDGGQSWNVLPGNPDPYEETFTIFADYNNPDRAIISYYGVIYLSNDGGDNFTSVHTAISTGTGVVVGGVFFDGQNIYIGTNDGLLVSTNGGASFTTDNSTGININQAIFSFAGAKQGNVTRFFILTADPLDIYVGIQGYDYWGFIKGVYSMDYGSGTWENRLPGIITGQDFLMFVAMAANDTGTAYLAGSSDLGVPNLMRWRSTTNQWQHVFETSGNQNIYTGWCGQGGDRGWGFAEGFFGIDVARFNSDKIIVTDYGYVHKSDDGGVTWKQAYVSPADQHPAGSTTPSQQAYHSCGIENTSCWQVFWRDQSNMLAAYSDITAVRSADAGASWSFNYSGIGINTVYRIAKKISGTTLYAATSSIHDIYQSTRLQDAILDAGNASGQVLFSGDNGNTWQVLHDFGHPVYWIATDPNNVNRLYASVVNNSANEGGIWVSSDIQSGASSTWTRITPPGRTEGHPGNIMILNDGTLLCSFSGRRNNAGAFTQSSGVFIYNPSLQVWSDKSDTRMFYWTHDVVVDPNDPNQNTWYAGVYSGWGGPPNGLGGLYKTTNRGSTWTRLSTLEGVTSITFNPNNPDQVFVSTEVDGLLTSTNINSASPTFMQVTTYPFRQPHRVYFNPYNNQEMWVGSFGNGMKVGSMVPTGINFTESSDALNGIYPNPAKDMIQIGIGSRVSSVEIFDSEGARVYLSETIQSPVSGTLQIDVKDLSRGIYTIRINGLDAVNVKRLVLE